MLVAAATAKSAAFFDSGLCPASYQGAAPRNGSAGVPVDLVPTAFFELCGAPPVGIARIWEGEEMVFEQRLEDESMWHALEYELQPNTELRITWTPADDEEQYGTFTVGERTHTPLERPPGLHSLHWNWDRSGDRTTFAVDVDVVPSPHGYTALELRDGSGDTVAQGIAYDARDRTLRGELPGRAQDPCLTLFQREVDGSWLEGDTECHEGRVSACSTAPVGGLLAALMALCGMRRRRW